MFTAAAAAATPTARAMTAAAVAAVIAVAAAAAATAGSYNTQQPTCSVCWAHLGVLRIVVLICHGVHTLRVHSAVVAPALCDAVCTDCLYRRCGHG